MLELPHESLFVMVLLLGVKFVGACVFTWWSLGEYNGAVFGNESESGCFSLAVVIDCRSILLSSVRYSKDEKRLLVLTGFVVELCRSLIIGELVFFAFVHLSVSGISAVRFTRVSWSIRVW